MKIIIAAVLCGEPMKAVQNVAGLGRLMPDSTTSDAGAQTLPVTAAMGRMFRMEQFWGLILPQYT